MATLNRNIITPQDISNYLNPNTATPATLDVNPPAGAVPGAGGVPADGRGPAPIDGGGAGRAANDGAGGGGAGNGRAPAGPGGVPVPTADDYLTRLVKYIPPEVVGAYLLLAGLIETNLAGKKNSSDLQAWLLGLLIVMAGLTVVYNKVVLRVVRKSQIAMSVLGLVVYVFVAGDWFATMGWYQQWYSTFALVGFGFVALLIKLPELPTPQPDPEPEPDL